MSSCAWAQTAINTTTFPDAAFREVVSNFDTNNDGILQDSEIAAVETINVRGLGISSLEGISIFTNLKNLACSTNNLTALDLSANTLLETLACDYNELGTLKLNNCRNLREVYCTNAGLSSLEVNGCTALQELYCYTNELDVLDVSSNTALVSLDCQDNNLTSLALSNNSRLQFLDCSSNQIPALSLSGNKALKSLYCHDLPLRSLNVSSLEDLRELWCWNDGLSALDITNNNKLESLICYGNNITDLALDGKTSLSELQCSGNPITENISINSLLSMIPSTDNSVLLNSITGNEGFSVENITALDANGKPAGLVNLERVDFAKVRATFDTYPALLWYNSDTGLENIKLSTMYVAEGANALAPCVNGIFAGTVSGDILTWKGIPYAKSPTGSLRWKAPEAPDQSSEVYSAVNFADTPLQHTDPHNPVEIMPRGEDCLALNVWTNGRSISNPKPVMVWIHGGAFNSGGTANPEYNGQNFVAAHDDVVFVSIGYRVGIMGFIDFANSGLPGCEEFPDSGNLGLLDMLQGLRWIQENIGAFGGDPNNVTVFGQSSGSACVALLMAMPESAGLFKRAITESGGVSMTSSVADCLPLTQALVQLTSADTMDKLMALSSSELLAATEKLQAYTNFPERDGRIVAANPYEAFKANSANFDILAGTNADEINYWSLATGAEGFGQLIQMGYYGYVGAINSFSSEDAAMAAQFIEQYKTDNETSSDVEAMCAFMNDLLFRGPTLAEMFNHNGKHYVYYWVYPSGIPGVGACHSLEMPYILNNDNILVPFQMNRSLAAKVQAMWINFAKTGNPSTLSTTWPAFTTSTQSTLIIDEPPAVKNGYLAERFALIQPLLKYMLSGRELISGVASLSGNTGGDTTTDPDSGTTSTDVTPVSPVSDDIGADPGKGDGGCNIGFTLPVILAGMYFALRRQ